MQLSEGPGCANNGHFCAYNTEVRDERPRVAQSIFLALQSAHLSVTCGRLPRQVGFAGRSLFAALAVLFGNGGWFGILGPLVLGGFMAWQIRGLDIDDPEQCLRLFRATRWGGFLMLGFLLLDAVL